MEKEKVIVFGVGNRGRQLYEFLDKNYDIVFAVDNNDKLWGTVYGKVYVGSPKVLLEEQYAGIKVVITPIYWEDILNQLYDMGVTNTEHLEIGLDKLGKERFLNLSLEKRKISCGKFYDGEDLSLRNVTFMPGGSPLLDYLLLRSLVSKYHIQTYLEVGTYIGESLRAVSDLCSECYSITAPPEHPMSMKEWCRLHGLQDYSNRLVIDKNIIQFFEDSCTFDYSKIETKIGLYFIDASHTYDAVCVDTAKIFSHRGEDSFVVWHDFKKNAARLNVEVVQAAYDTIGEDRFNQVFIFDNNNCGVYVPAKYVEQWKKSYALEPEILYNYGLTISVQKN